MSCRSWSKIALTAGALLLAVSSGLAQKVKDTGPKYDVANEVKITGRGRRKFAKCPAPTKEFIWS